MTRQMLLVLFPEHTMLFPILNILHDLHIVEYHTCHGRRVTKEYRYQGDVVMSERSKAHSQLRSKVCILRSRGVIYNTNSSQTGSKDPTTRVFGPYTLVLMAFGP